ncbi:MAG: hypothetical protein ACOYL6_00035 [Bacteriovoracaceae bacterium]
MFKIKKILVNSVLIFSFLMPSVPSAWANKKEEEDTSPINLQDMVLPTDIKDMAKQPGAIFYSSPSKNKVLVPVHLWGHLQKPGLHFVPTETNFIKVMSSTGGPLPGAALENVTLTRSVNGEAKKFSFDLSNGGGEDVQNFTVRSGDIIFVKQDRFYENRAYYTSLIAIAVSVLTGVLLYRQIQKN